MEGRNESHQNKIVGYGFFIPNDGYEGGGGGVVWVGIV